MLSYTAQNIPDAPVPLEAQKYPGCYQASETSEEMNKPPIAEDQGGSSTGLDGVSVALFQLSDVSTQTKM